MKKCYFFLLLLSCASLMLQASNIVESEDTEYPLTEQIIVTEDGLFALLNDEFVKIGLSQDGVDCVRVVWECPHCGHINNCWNAHCKRCGK